MHILHYCTHTGGVMYEWHQSHFLDELERAGYVITDCNPIQQLGRIGNTAEYSEVLVKTAKHMVKTPGPHLLIAASATDFNIDPSAIELIRDLGIPTVNLSVDDVVAPYRFRKVGSHFDIHWTTFLGTENRLRRYGCNPVYMPMAANPHFFRCNRARREHQLCFVGSSYGARAQYVSNLAQAGVPLRVRGKGWVRSGTPIGQPVAQSYLLAKIIAHFKVLIEYAQFSEGRKIIAGAARKRLGMYNAVGDPVNLPNVDIGSEVSLGDMVDIYTSCTTSLGVLEIANTHLLSKPLYQYRLRDFEAPMMGCAHLVRRTPELQAAFTEDSEMIFYSSIEECVDKARFYLAPHRQELVEKIGVHARTRAEREHTWLCRFKKLRELLRI